MVPVFGAGLLAVGSPSGRRLAPGRLAALAVDGVIALLSW